ncbi:hypothetical protein [Methylobacterium radiodurans]|uniref:Uncharacterized protein n=1 Tax=Methylobacterium radiodurans TaxID=2202828 RepID=A0A2U8VU66_9HYPH|nr:hypothetical protein [Methylobacterium radiodurans]AWN36940.1 hypothetical protein DK427_15355 [Methylobacterium radiodurans]
MSRTGGFDRERFAKFVKCRAMMERGATAGERAAGAAAAARIAAASGLSLAEALRLTGGGPPPRDAPRGPQRRPPPWEKAPLRADPIGLDEILAQKAKTEAHRKRKAADAARARRADLATEAAERAALREAQEARDRAWAEARERRGDA